MEATPECNWSKNHRHGFRPRSKTSNHKPFKLDVQTKKEQQVAADKLISSGGPWESVIGYSRATVAGEYVHVSGSTATIDGELQHKGDAYGQTLTTLNEVIAKALAQVGYGLEDVVRSRVYLANAEDMDAVGKAHGEIFGEIRPAATMLAGIQFINKDMLVEIEVDAWKRAN
jgi:enamine deaminase RidA (YjgF/YER057c/UK114 family)